MNKIIEICLILVLTAACRQSDETGDEFDYPVCIDMDNRMGELNGFTADTYLLLDAEHLPAAGRRKPCGADRQPDSR